MISLHLVFRCKFSFNNYISQHKLKVDKEHRQVDRELVVTKEQVDNTLLQVASTKVTNKLPRKPFGNCDYFFQRGIKNMQLTQNSVTTELEDETKTRVKKQKKAEEYHKYLFISLLLILIMWFVCREKLVKETKKHEKHKKTIVTQIDGLTSNTQDAKQNLTVIDRLVML